MKKTIILALLALLTLGAGAQTQKEMKKWMRKGEWRGNFHAASPHKTVNAAEFYTQYHKNPGQWQALFQWLATTDLTAIEKGKHPIPGTTLVASVEDSENQPLEKRRSESHRRHIDFQYVVKGTEGFALLDHATSPANCAYDEKKDVIHYDYDPLKTNFFECAASQDRFVIFFPGDWHIAKIATKKSDQRIRVIVVKVDYVE